MDLKTIGKKIEERRKLLHLRQEDLAEMSKVTSKTIYNIEDGKGNPSFKTLSKIGEILGLEIKIEIKKVI